MTTKTLTQTDLDMFTGSEQFYRHSINRKVIYTEGAHHVAEAGGAYWLLDEIALIQPHAARVAAEEFQVWKLTVRPDRDRDARLRGRQRQRRLLERDSLH